MNEFDLTIDAARKKQRRVYFLSGGVIFAGIILVASLLVGINGTPINVSPAEAKQTALFRLESGIGFFLSDVLYSLPDSPTINVAADGFVSKDVKLNTANLGKTFNVQLDELPGELTITTVPARENTKWLSEGVVLSRSSSFKQDVLAGRITITIDNPYFMQQTLSTDVGRGEQKNIQIKLEPAQAIFEISSTPKGATVTLDGNNVGTTPLKLNENAGSYQFQISKPQFTTITETIFAVRPKIDINRHYQLEVEKAYLTFEISPQGGNLLIDGRRISPAGTTAIDAMAPHKITYSKKGYFAQGQTVNLAVGAQKALAFNLQKEVGIVELTSTPTAMVSINGKVYGNTPLELTLPAVVQKITFGAAGYKTVTKTATPSSKSTQSISVILVDVAKATIAAAPTAYTNKAGIKLNLFRPNETFFMGAPRHEKGQRANEFIRNILLDKPFYAGTYEVTNAQFSMSKKTTTGPANNPVTDITWLDAVQYCNWLSANEGLAPFYITNSVGVSGVSVKSNGYRLLTEAEWEWLARKANKSKQTKFTWGDKTVIPSKAANVADESAKGTAQTYVPNYTDGFSGVAPVGSMNKEPSGLYDIAGNVSEWVHDSYNLIPPTNSDVVSNPMGDATNSTHVIKGANWRSATLTELRPAFRDGFTQGRNDLGFRVGRYLNGGTNE